MKKNNGSAGSIIVMKFGGTSLRSEESRAHAIKHIRSHADRLISGLTLAICHHILLLLLIFVSQSHSTCYFFGSSVVSHASVPARFADVLRIMRMPANGPGVGLHHFFGASLIVPLKIHFASCSVLNSSILKSFRASISFSK